MLTILKCVKQYSRQDTYIRLLEKKKKKKQNKTKQNKTK